MNVQMNVRIDDELKRAGDNVFSEIGLTPSDVVRNVWRFAVDHGEAPAIVREALVTTDAQFRKADARRRMEEAENASRICQHLRSEFNLQTSDCLEELDYRELRERAVRERLAERQLT